MDVGTTPVIFLWRVRNCPVAGLSIPVRIQHKVNAPCRKQECKNLGLGAHGLIPVIIPLTLDVAVQITGIQPFLRIIHPVNDFLIYFDGGISRLNPGFINTVAVQTERIRIGCKGIISFCL